MKALSSFEVFNVSGGIQLESDLLSRITEYSFYTTLVGCMSAGIFLITQDITASNRIVVGATTILRNSAFPLVLNSLAVFWMAGVVVALGCEYLNQ